MPSDPAVIADRPPSPPSSWLVLRALPEYAARARAFARSEVDGSPHDPYEVALLVSEIVTNAIVATAAMRAWPYDVYPIGMNLVVTDRYMHLAVTDPDHRPLPASDEGGQLAEHGRGLHIVDEGAVARWTVYFEHGKTVHVVIAAPDVVLTAAELEQIGVPT
ncbi:ATP-binding protein [Actinoallomurus sp. CA-150999]|uniref:ATP-binding protein n=1 Tax=Actinoallomurus sp. CA-150999 TaxID=3239887 RepID=UPI003D89C6F4